MGRKKGWRGGEYGRKEYGALGKPRHTDLHLHPQATTFLSPPGGIYLILKAETRNNERIVERGSNITRSVLQYRHRRRLWPEVPSSSPSLTVSHCLTLAKMRPRTMCARESSGGGRMMMTRRTMSKDSATPSRLSGRTPRCDVASLMPAPTRACPVSSTVSCKVDLGTFYAARLAAPAWDHARTDRRRQPKHPCRFRGHDS